MNILLVDDEKIKRLVLRDDLAEAGYNVRAASNAEEGLEHLDKEHFDVVVTDLRMNGMDGLTFLKKVKENQPEIDVVMITAYATVDNAVEAMKIGAFDYITKPFESAKLILILEKIEKIRQLTRENTSLRAALERVTRHGDIISQSEAMHDALEFLETAVNCEAPILLCGETGTGKELFATAIHKCGPRKDQPFIRVSCAALSQQLMESELFGHERGAFTGATDEKPGRFELADKGTLFLDEIDDIPIEIQVKLLRVLDGMPFERVGGVRAISTDLRFIAASKVDLKEKVDAGAFRSDLYFRLNVFPIWIPPLRARKEDIPLLFNHFLEKYGSPGVVYEITEEAIALLWDYQWPGNIRELQNVTRRILLCLGGRNKVCVEDIPTELRNPEAWPASLPAQGIASQQRSFTEVIQDTEREMLIAALESSHGNQSKAAASLGLKLSTFRDKLAKHNMLHTST